MLSENIKQNLKTKIIGQEFFYYDVLTSTNELAKKYAEAGATDGTLILADAQTKGRGRFERAFFSPPKLGLWFSIILRPPIIPQEAPKLTFMTAVALIETMKEYGVSAGIKWPNDIIIDGKKLVGISNSISTKKNNTQYIILGIGINVNFLKEDFPDDLQLVATSLCIIKGEKLSRSAFLLTLLQKLDALYNDILQNGFAAMLTKWRLYSATLGQEIYIYDAQSGERQAGKATDIDSDGALIVETTSGKKKFLAGDVTIRRQK